MYDTRDRISSYLQVSSLPLYWSNLSSCSPKTWQWISRQESPASSALWWLTRMVWTPSFTLWSSTRRSTRLRSTVRTSTSSTRWSSSGGRSISRSARSPCLTLLRKQLYVKCCHYCLGIYIVQSKGSEPRGAWKQGGLAKATAYRAGTGTSKQGIRELDGRGSQTEEAEHKVSQQT